MVTKQNLTGSAQKNLGISPNDPKKIKTPINRKFDAKENTKLKSAQSAHSDQQDELNTPVPNRTGVNP